MICRTCGRETKENGKCEWCDMYFYEEICYKCGGKHSPSECGFVDPPKYNDRGF